MNTYFISDTHFGHTNVIRFDERPFTSIEEMDKIMIEKWNNKVSNEDHVYILGDFIWSTASSEHYNSIASSLHGQKHLILGNHDPKDFSKEQRRKFGIVETTNLKEIRYESSTYGIQHVILCHYPIPFHRSAYSPAFWMFYGHVHNTREETLMNTIRSNLITTRDSDSGNAKGHLINVGCMMPYMNYEPCTFEEILERNKFII